MPSKKQENGRVSPADWAAARDEYVTGDKSYAMIAADLGVTLNAVKKHALDRDQNGGRTWAEWREEFQAEVSGQKTEVVKRIKVDAAAKVSMRHAEMLASLANDAREAVAEALALCEPKDKVKLALAIIAAERRVHGLDRVPVQVELTGKDGGPIEHDVEHDFDDASVAAAQRMLEAFFGPTQPAK
jgi:hypothetical protein